VGTPQRHARAGTSPGLSFPTAHQGSKVHFPRALPARYVPPSGFGYPLDGFLPSNPRRFCFAPAALLGFTLRSFLLSKGIRAFPPGCTHIPFLPVVFLPQGDRAEDRAAVPGLRPFRESLASNRAFNAIAAGCSPGFRPSRAFGDDLARDFAQAPLLRFSCTPRRGVPRRSRVSIGQGLTRSRRYKILRAGCPPRVLRRSYPESLKHADSRAMGSPSAASHITADRQTVLGSRPRLAGADLGPTEAPSGFPLRETWPSTPHTDVRSHSPAPRMGIQPR
jgi:hypothetical protein